MSAPTLAVDFGTSNTAAAIVVDGALRRIPIEGAAETLPTAVFFPADKSEMLIGAAAAEALIAGDEGRYMRALKSVLGTPLLHEMRLIGGKRRTLASVITDFLIELKARAEAQTGLRFTKVLSGRPVQFHSNSAEKDIAAEADLRACYEAAGFSEIDFLYEPEAAAWACRDMGTSAETGLIVDIGGGTSDFTLFRAAAGQIEILASHGIRLGGTDFDHSVSMDHAMPELGLGGRLTRSLAEGLLPIPRALYVDLSTWAMIPFLYSRETEREVQDWLRHAVEPVPLERLKTVIEDQLGHELAFSVERGKIAANAAQLGATINMGFIERGLAPAITEGSLNRALAGWRDELRQAIYATFLKANIAPQQIGRVILVGGSSLLSMVKGEAQSICPQAELHFSEVFTAVVDGLAIASVSQAPKG